MKCEHPKYSDYQLFDFTSCEGCYSLAIESFLQYALNSEEKKCVIDLSVVGSSFPPLVKPLIHYHRKIEDAGGKLVLINVGEEMYCFLQMATLHSFFSIDTTV